MCLLAKYANKTSGVVDTKLLELVDCSAKKSYVKFKSCLNKFDIPLKNVIGVACDGPTGTEEKQKRFF